MNLPPEEPTALKPCPFCGGEAEIERVGNMRQSQIYSCTNCGCFLETGEIGGVNKWNTRADAAPDTSAEPVAWIIGENPNAWATLRRDLLSSVKPGTKVTPLYTHPAPSPDHEPMVQIQALGWGQ